MEMASQRRQAVFRFILITFGLPLVLLIMCQADLAASSSSMDVSLHFSKISSSEDIDSENRVNLSVYYESLCPYCANFIVNHLVNIFHTDLLNIVNLRLVPWGNTQIRSNDSWICQHGVDECELDVTEACAINAWPRVEAHFKFIYCVERLHLMNRHAEWPSCYAANGLDPQPIEDCYNNGLGYQLEKAYADETATLNPQHRFVPWVVVDNFPLQEDFENFIGYICKAYRGDNIPNACKSTSFEINSFAVATWTPQVCARLDVIDRGRRQQRYKFNQHFDNGRNAEIFYIP
ncbi:gamma-interferon-inducible lysosomal thiol reductase [Sesamum indicum]|uniref:Gamma-interferon-inducible lysosomal thiol reductase n=1 Tax=Sesamum indicum TaxID=4182 RepID=A0A6I9TA74_SESIN|nr:gamma-interferon-inducible lysosomal thiol reductase [Sesamum indicum]